MISTLTALLLSGVTVTLPMEAHTRGTELTVGAVVQVTGPDSALAAKVGSLSLGFAPAPGFSRLLWSYQIAERIKQFDSSLQVTFQGHEATRVWPVVDTVPAADLTAVASAEVARVVGRKDVEWKMREHLDDLRVPATDQPAELIAKPGRGSLEAGLVNVPIEVRVGGEMYRTIWTSWSVEAFQTVPVLVTRVEPGETLRPSMFENRRVPKKGNVSRPLTADLVVGSKAVRQLVEGSVVTAMDVHRPPAIQVGDALFLQVRKGRVVARVAVEARQAGSIGDRIKVVRVDTGAEFSAIILSRDLAQIVLAS